MSAIMDAEEPEERAEGSNYQGSRLDDHTAKNLGERPSALNREALQNLDRGQRKLEIAVPGAYSLSNVPRRQ